MRTFQAATIYIARTPGKVQKLVVPTYLLFLAASALAALLPLAARGLLDFPFSYLTKTGQRLLLLPISPWLLALGAIIIIGLVFRFRFDLSYLVSLARDAIQPRSTVTIYIARFRGNLRKLIVPNYASKLVGPALAVLLLLSLWGIYDILLLRSFTAYLLLPISIWVLVCVGIITVSFGLQLLVRHPLLRSFVLATASLILLTLFVRAIYPYLPHRIIGATPFNEHTLKRLLEAIALLFGFVGALLAFFAGGLNNSEKSASQDFFRSVYERINATTWRRLPHLVSLSLLHWLRALRRRQLIDLREANDGHRGRCRFLAGLSVIFLIIPLVVRLQSEWVTIRPVISVLLSKIFGDPLLAGIAVGVAVASLSALSALMSRRWRTFLSRPLNFLSTLNLLVVATLAALLLWFHWNTLKPTFLHQITGISSGAPQAVFRLFLLYGVLFLAYCFVLFRGGRRYFSGASDMPSQEMTIFAAVLVGLALILVWHLNKPLSALSLIPFALICFFPLFAEIGDKILEPYIEQDFLPTAVSSFLLFLAVYLYLFSPVLALGLLLLLVCILLFGFLSGGGMAYGLLAAAAPLLVMMTATTALYMPLIDFVGFAVCLAPFAGLTQRERYQSDPDGLNPLVLSKPLSLTIIVSSSWTLLALALGETLDPTLPAPRTLQMFVSNTLFDSLTILLTIWLLVSCLRPARRLHPFVALLLAIVSGGLFAIASLWFGVIRTDFQLGFKQVFVILVGRSLDGMHFEFGPAFWTMHTTFIPTLLYLILVVTAFVTKSAISLTTSFLRRAQLREVNPVRWISDILLFISATIGLIAFFVID